MEFGDNHDEARLNTYYKALETLIPHKLTFDQSLLSVRNGQTFSFGSMDSDKCGNITICVNENKDIAVKIGILRSVLQYILHRWKPID
ncbi:hypothetical protein OSK38_26795, partial [Escherichia coli]|nr:hypothetical protein [Escherichia coli]